MSIARLRPIARESGTIGVEQNRPIFTPGVANRASSAATARSHAATSWQPAAVAMPSTCAITGCGTLWIVAMSSEQTSNSRWKKADVAVDHLAEVVARRERGARGLDDDRADARLVARAPQRGDQLLHELEAQRVAPFSGDSG